jgi:hypothetical protein
LRESVTEPVLALVVVSPSSSETLLLVVLEAGPVGGAGVVAPELLFPPPSAGDLDPTGRLRGAAAAKDARRAMTMVEKRILKVVGFLVGKFGLLVKDLKSVFC